MRYLILAAVVVIAHALAGVASAESTYVRVESMGRKAASKTTWKTDYGSFEKQYAETRGVTVTVRNNNTEAASYTVSCYFIAETLDGKGRSIFDWASESVALGSGEEKTISKESRKITGQDTKYAALGEREKTGGQYDGWYVVVRRGDTIIKTKSSKGASRQYDQKIMKLIDALKDAKAPED